MAVKNNDSNKVHTATDEIREALRLRLQQFFQWLKPNGHEPFMVNALRYLYKIPALILAVALSPVLLIVLFFAFVAAF